MIPRHRYFPVNETQREWGLYVTCVGHTRSGPGAEFPDSAHPDEYSFSWEKGRVLREWQIVLIEDGCGTAEFKTGKRLLSKGSLMVLPPDCWHRYRPDPKTGWTTLWIGFGGELADRLIGGAGFRRSGDVLDIPDLHGFHHAFAETVSDVIVHGHDDLYSIAARIPALVAKLIEERNRKTSATSRTELVHRAQTDIAARANGIIDFEALASSLGVPYRTFRHIFSAETGTSPHRYQLEIRLARAKNLLRSTDMPISEIAKSLGFNSTWYFSHFFRKRVRMSAASFRKLTGES